MFVIQVPSSKPGEKYTVRKAGNVWVCSCSDHVFRSNGLPYTCKHISEVAASLFAHIADSALSVAAREMLRPAADQEVQS